MKSVLGPILGAWLFVSAPATAAPIASRPQAEAAELAEARAIIEIMYPSAERQKTFDKLMTDISAQFRQSVPPDTLTDPGLNAIVHEFLDSSMRRVRPVLHKHLPDTMAAMAVAYTNEFSLAELKDIHAFAQTPSGRRYLSRSVAIISDPAVAKVNSAMMTELFELNTAMRAELRDEILAYLKVHPDVAAKLAPEKKEE